MSQLSIRWRLTLWYSAILALILALFGGVVYLLMGSHLLERLDSQLSAELNGIDEELEESSTLLGIRARLHRRFGHYEQFLFDIRNVENDEVLFTRQLGSMPFPQTSAGESSGVVTYETYQSPQNERFRIASRKITGPVGPLWARVAASLKLDDHELSELLASLLVAGPLALGAAVAGGYFLARRSLAPIDQITQLARDITVGRLDRRIHSVNGHDELGRLANTFNEMIDRLEKSFSDMQQFTADAAHELRTPVSILRTEAEVTLRQPRSADEYRSALESLLEESERLTTLADRLLFLSREDAGMGKANFSIVQLDEIASDILEHMRVLADQKGVAVNAGALARCSVCGNADTLRRLLFNLLQNAVKFTPEGGKVTLEIHDRTNEVEIVISDTGCGIAEQHLPRVFNRFYRGDAAREGQGTGLGLAISRAIAETHEGSISIKSQVGRGTQVTVKLPRPA